MRAQIQSQVIVYILAVFIMALVLIFGYKAINDIRANSELAAIALFRQDLTNGIANIASSYGSSKVLSLSCPAKFTKVCFVNLDHVDANTGENDVLAQIDLIVPPIDPIIKNSVGSTVNVNSKFAKVNVFLCPGCTEQLYVGRIAISDDNGADTVFRCFTPIQGVLKLTVEGLGDGARIS